MTTAIRHDAEWRSASACRHANPDLFFPVATTASERAAQIAKAKAICAGCPVRSQCLEFARANELNYGIWGGTTPEDRTRIRRREQRAARARARAHYDNRR
jgi:WhiB family transcriptional regulator, redox-sensing transcriptional regulator